jgi:hypothetical protein
MLMALSIRKIVFRSLHISSINKNSYDPVPKDFEQFILHPKLKMTAEDTKPIERIDNTNHIYYISYYPLLFSRSMHFGECKIAAFSKA